MFNRSLYIIVLSQFREVRDVFSVAWLTLVGGVTINYYHYYHGFKSIPLYGTLIFSDIISHHYMAHKYGHVVHHLQIIGKFIPRYPYTSESNLTAVPVISVLISFKCFNVFDRKIINNWCKTMLFDGITHSNKNIVNRRTIGLEWLE